MKRHLLMSSLLVAVGLVLPPIGAALADAPAGNVAAVFGNAEGLGPVAGLVPSIGHIGDNFVQKMQNAGTFVVFDLPKLLTPAELTEVKQAEAGAMAALSRFQAEVNEDSGLSTWLTDHGIPVGRIVALEAHGDRIEVYLL